MPLLYRIFSYACTKVAACMAVCSHPLNYVLAIAGFERPAAAVDPPYIALGGSFGKAWRAAARSILKQIPASSEAGLRPDHPLLRLGGRRLAS